MLRISDRVEGASAAPAAPSSARAAMSISGLVENAATTEAAPKAAAAVRSSLRRPIRSPEVLMVASSPAATKPYTSTIHSSWELVGARSALRDGTARFSTVRSME